MYIQILTHFKEIGVGVSLYNVTVHLNMSYTSILRCRELVNKKKYCSEIPLVTLNLYFGTALKKLSIINK